VRPKREVGCGARGEGGKGAGGGKGRKRKEGEKGGKEVERRGGEGSEGVL